MRLHSELIKVNDSLCYQVRKEYSGIDTTAWEPFCGVLDNFYFRSWYEYTLQVEEYNPHADTICVIKTIAQYPKGQFMKIHRNRIMVNDSLCIRSGRVLVGGIRPLGSLSAENSVTFGVKRDMNTPCM